MERANERSKEYSNDDDYGRYRNQPRPNNNSFIQSPQVKVRFFDFAQKALQRLLNRSYGDGTEILSAVIHLVQW